VVALASANNLALVALVVALVALVLFATGAGFGHSAGLVGEGFPQCPPYISTTAF